MKRQLIEASFGRKTAEHALSGAHSEITSLKGELKAKGDLMQALEKERRTKVAYQNYQPYQQQQNSPVIVAVKPRPRSVSADRLMQSRHLYGRQLLFKSSSPAAYEASKRKAPSLMNLTDEAMAKEEEEEEDQEMEKVVLLQKLLLAKNRQVIEREVKIEEIEKELGELRVQCHRLSKVRLLARELTDLRHHLNVRTTQLEALKQECSKSKLEVSELKEEVGRLRSRLAEFYSEKIFLVN